MRDVRWRKSSYSEDGGNNCVEVAAVAGKVAIRDSKRPERVLPVRRAAFHAMVSAASSGRLERPVD